jgi:8-oxo-dGTP pyrophosphatase MutT (NUDIX family)
MYKITAAGILPISVDKKGNIYLLLGKESYKEGYSDSNKWSDFGGKLEKGETPMQGAIREFDEETMSLWSDKQKMLEILSKETIYSYRDRFYVEYVILFEYTSDIISQFKRVYNHFKDCCNKEGLLEKSEIKWFPLDTIHTIKDLRGNFKTGLLENINGIRNAVNKNIKSV